MWAHARCLGTGALFGAVAANVANEYADKNPVVAFPSSIFGIGGGSALSAVVPVPVIKMSGSIESPRAGALSPQSINLQKYEQTFEQAFRAKPAAVVIEMNSPGGSPAQSALIHARLLELRKQYPEVNRLVLGPPGLLGSVWLRGGRCK